ncbi:hypothetical protein SERLADRAFT_435459 [Serpula lacrymans var. lacrymans S7.9]|uniref:Uncharacterized protein n=1 Tax=Serpula lacrymans var. lacrymans (strain S7.9) TaxID=578457 RepID=F8NPK2_SERL9|nr:uncharacterized protein SERLADRAFT_435459 [Serpula lacrymans var. lacrymans S7.9]EGO27693.1 hypothetical protein SERLADRAFT_435459 [Serpula lacrymans var. lacrymans S7.9]
MFGGLLSIKEEEDPGADSPQDLLDRTCNSNIELASILQDLNIDPTLLLAPQSPPQHSPVPSISQAASCQAVSPVASSSEFLSVHAKRKHIHDLTCEETPAEPKGPMQKKAQLTTVSQDLEGEHKLAVSEQRMSGSDSTAIQLFKVFSHPTSRLLTQLPSKFKLAKSGCEAFWRKHCLAISLVKADTNKKHRKTQVCSQCRTIKFPGSTDPAYNHKKKHCSDKVPVTINKPASDLPPWPQPQGIFNTDGADLAMEYEALTKMLTKRVVDPSMPNFTVICNGQNFLRIDCLCQT